MRIRAGPWPGSYLRTARDTRRPPFAGHPLFLTDEIENLKKWRYRPGTGSTQLPKTAEVEHRFRIQGVRTLKDQPDVEVAVVVTVTAPFEQQLACKSSSGKAPIGASVRYRNRDPLNSIGSKEGASGKVARQCPKPDGNGTKSHSSCSGDDEVPGPAPGNTMTKELYPEGRPNGLLLRPAADGQRRCAAAYAVGTASAAIRRAMPPNKRRARWLFARLPPLGNSKKDGKNCANGGGWLIDAN